MKERPILFNAEMVRAILDWRKTQTRRVMKVQPKVSECVLDQLGEIYRWNQLGDFFGSGDFKCPFGKVGDRLWVREKFSQHQIPDGEPYFYPADRLRECINHEYGFHYWADGDPKFGDWEKPKPSIFMPRLASRITLEITDIRVERLNDISDSDCIAEGIEKDDVGWRDYLTKNPGENICAMPSWSYRSLWESINSPGSWDKNPFVWVIEFKRIEVKNASL